MRGYKFGKKDISKLLIGIVPQAKSAVCGGMVMKKILMIPTRGMPYCGLCKVMMQLMLGCSHKKYSFAVIIDKECGIYEEYKELALENKVEIFYVGSKKKYWSYCRQISEIIKENHFDMVHVHGNSAMMLLDILPAWFAGCPCRIAHCHNTQTNFPAVNRLLRPIFTKLTTDRLACSGDAGRWAYKKGFTVILNGIDETTFSCDEKRRERLRVQQGIQDKYVVGHVGAFNYQKNHEFLIRVFYRLKKRCPDAVLLLVGDGEEMPLIRRLVSKRKLDKDVIFAGQCEDVKDKLLIMDCFVMPSRFEGFCIAAIEAQAAGLPIVLADTIPRQVLFNGMGCYLPLGEEEVWVDAILKCRGKRAEEDITSLLTQKGLTLKQMIQKMEAVYDK